MLISCLLLFIVGAVEVQAQTAQKQPYSAVNLQSEAQQILGNIKESAPKTFNYNETPSFALKNRNKSFWNKLTPQQMQVLESYGFPKYISYGVQHVERDIMTYSKALKKWDNDNMYRQTEILNAMGIKK